MRTVDLFAGCGGLSLGFQNAGFDVVAAFEYWDVAADCYEKNFSHPGFRMDLSDAEEAVRTIKRFNPEVIIGGPPCQDFSHAGKRVEAGRAVLTESYAEIVKAVNEVFNHYINRLTDICPISQTDIELCCLIKLRCTHKQIAEMLAIDPTSVSKRKVRLRSTLEKHVELGEGKFALEHWLWDF